MRPTPSRLAFALLFILFATPALADRRAELRAALGDTISAERQWSNTWGLRWGTLAMLQLTAAQLSVTESRHADFYVGASGSTVGFLVSYAIGPRVLYRKIPIDGADEAELEAALADAAAEQRLMHSLAAHIAGKVFTLGLASIMGFAYHHWVQAGLATAAGFVLGEWMIGSRPRTAIEWVEGHAKRHTANPPPELSLAVANDATALSLRFYF